MTIAIENWAEQVRAGDVRAISRAVSAIENREPEAEEILRAAISAHWERAYRVGITGAPGTGKSTLVDRLAAHYRAAKKGRRNYRRGSLQPVYRRVDSGRSNPDAGAR